MYESSSLLDKHLPYSEEIKRTLKSAIYSGELKPGERIVETRWAKKLGVSQAPVREAIRSLVSAGIVDSIPYKGAFVRNISSEDMIHCYIARMAIEPIGARDACKVITDDDIRQLQEHNDKMMEAAKADDEETYIEVDAEFHNKIMSLSDNFFLKRLWEQCEINVWTRIGTQFSHKSRIQLARRHDSIVEALKNRNPDAAEYASKKHIQDLIEELNSEEYKKEIK